MIWGLVRASMFHILLFWICCQISAQNVYSHEISKSFRGKIAGAVVELNEGYLCTVRGDFPNDSVGEQIVAVLVDKQSGQVLDVDAFYDQERLLFLPGNFMVEHDGLAYIFAEGGNRMFVYTYDGSTGQYLSSDTIFLEKPGQRFGFTRIQGYENGIFDIWTQVVDDSLSAIYKGRISYNLHDQTWEQYDFNFLPDIIRSSTQIQTDSSTIFFGNVDRRLSVIEVVNDVMDFWSDPEDDLAMLGEQLLLTDEFAYLSCVHFLPNGNSMWVPALAKYDLVTRTLLWYRKVGFENYSSYNGVINNIIPSLTDEDTYLIPAETVWYDSETDSLYAPAIVMKINYAGEVQWSREYRFHHANGVYHQLCDMEPTSDGNYICLGDIDWFVEPPDSIVSSSTWLFKINEDGYIVGAGGGVSTEDEANNIDGVQLWPNPIQGELYINQDDLTDVTYTFYTSTGQLVEKISLDRPYQSLIVATGHWPSGILTVAITQRGELLGTQQMVKI